SATQSASQPNMTSSTQSDNYRLQDSDEFSAPALGLQWSWNHNPDATRWSLTQRPGFMRIEGNRARHLVGARNTLTQILQGPAAEITTRIELQGMAEAQRAGLSLFGVKVPWIGIVREAGANHVTYANAGEETRGPRIDGKSVVLRASVRSDQTVQFSWAPDDNGPFTDFGPVTELAKFSWWKGSRPAVFTYIRADSDEGKSTGPVDRIEQNYIDVDWFRVRIVK
ncbi:MAG TPA: hypothetical protein VF774_01500, partial [Pseudoduganella sp.]